MFNFNYHKPLLLLSLTLLISMHEAWAQTTWRRTYGGFGIDEGACVRQTTSGNFIVVGSTGSFGHGSSDVYLLLLDANGDPIWSKNHGSIGTETGVACRELVDGFIVAGTTSIGNNGAYDMFLMKIDQQGDLIWENHYGTPDWDFAQTVEVLPDGFVLGGWSLGAGTPESQAYVVRTDMSGNAIWTKTIGGALGAECSGIAITAGLDIILSGSIGSPNGLCDGFVAKLDLAGNELWSVAVGGDSTDYFSSVLETSSGGLVLCGGTDSYGTVREIYLVELDANGQVIWQQHFGNSADAAASEIRLDHDSGYVFTGYNSLNFGNRDMIITTAFPAGWFNFGFDFGNGQPADGLSVDITSDGGYVVAGWVEGYGPGYRSVYVVKTDTIGQTTSLVVDEYADPLPVHELPPATNSLQVIPSLLVSGQPVKLVGLTESDRYIAVYDAVGSLVWSGQVSGNSAMVQLPFLPGGSYTILCHDGYVRRTARFQVH